MNTEKQIYSQQTRDGVASTETAHIYPVESQKKCIHKQPEKKIGPTMTDYHFACRVDLLLIVAIV